MQTEVPPRMLEYQYYWAAQEYLRNLPPEHFMEATPQATQREITLESLALLRVHRPDVQVFNELLVQYPMAQQKRPGQVVPDNMVVLSEQPIKAEGSYDLPLQPVSPFWVLEYVSKKSERKDYVDSMEKYEHHLRVPYYLVFYPDNQDLTLFQHNGEIYLAQPPNDQGRCSIPELELELALLGGWVRFWFRGELLPLPPDLLRQVESLRRELEAKSRELEARSRELEARGRELEAKSRELEARDREIEGERQKRLALEAELDAFRRNQRGEGKIS